MKQPREELEQIFVNEFRAAEILGVSVKTLRKWRLFSTGPQFYKLRKCVRYECTELVAWARSEPGIQR